jgi:hypothetical protein
LHDPAAARSQSLDAWFDEIRGIRFADAITVFLREPDAEPGLGDPAEALAVLGARLSRLGRARPGVFLEELRSRIVARESSRLAHARKALAGDLPAFYAKLHERYAQVMQEAITTDAYLAPRDLPGASAALTQSLVGRIGSLLEAWPRIWNAAAWLQAGGRRLSRPLN